MRIFGTVIGVILILVGAALLIDAFTHSIGINLLAAGPSNSDTEGNGVLGIAVGALPAVVGLVILSKLHAKPDPPRDAD
ncbi:hypothetical protein OT109_11060 [Phycisphaeraceae bacterium D3-23]